MIDADKAMEIAREELADDVSRGGMVTLFGYADHWQATCTFPDRSTPAGLVPKRVRINRGDGKVVALS